MSHNQKLYLLIVSFLSLSLRLIKLGAIPANLSQKEILIADKIAPLIGYHQLVLRLPFTLIFSFSVPLLVLLVWRINQPKQLIFDPGAWTGVLLTVSPWHLLLSRRAEILLSYWQNLSLEDIGQRFFSYLSLKYLFLSGDNVFLLSASSGLLLSASLISLFISLMLVRKFDSVFWQALVIILVGSALASLQPHLDNAPALFIALFGWTLLSGWGIAKLAHWLQLKPNLLKVSLALALLGIFAYQVVSSLHNLYIHHQKKSQAQWELIYKPLAEYLVKNQDHYLKILIIPQYAYPLKYLNWYSKGKIDLKKIVVDKYSADYQDKNMLLIGPIHHKQDFNVAQEFFLETGSEVLFAKPI